MANFKYNVSFLPKDDKQAREYFEIMKEIGYEIRRGWDSHSLQNYIVNTYTIGVIQRARRDTKHKPHIFHGENEWEYEAAKAIASIHQDDKYHDGEWVVFDNGQYNDDQYYTIGNLYQLGGRHYHFDIQSTQRFYTRADNFGDANGSFTFSFHKASPEEIITFFKQKYGVMENKEIVGYRLLKDTPTLKAGIEFKFDKNKEEWCYTRDADEFTYWYTQREIDSANGWFEPIYRDVEVVKKLGLGSMDTFIMITSKKRITTTRSSTPIKIEKLLELLDHIDAMNKIEISDWGAYIAKDVRCIRIGCQTENNLFSYNEIQRVINIYNELNPQLCASI